ncbi:MAG: DUF4097 domain-containing protein [Gemmatimonadaceae bacterium]|nr:DUF4097 domain-containing protein [Gemmatimonadaceae bacterium]
MPRRRERRPRRWLIVGALLAVVHQPPALGAQPASATSMANRGWRVHGEATVRVYLPAGRLTVETWDRDSVHLAGTLGPNAMLFGNGAPPHVKVGVEARSRVDSTLPQAWLVVQVPRRARLWVKAIDAELDLAGTQVELEAYTVRGAIRVRDVRGSTTIESIDAPVRLADASGDVRVRGSRATVECTRVHALATISTVSGAVVLRSSQVEGRVETVGGAITLDAVRPGGSLSLQSHAGDITLSLSTAARPVLQLWSRGGAVRQGQQQGDVRYGTIEARSFRGNVTVRTPY